MIDRFMNYRGELKAIADISGLSRSILSDIKNGKVKNPGYYTVQKIADALDQLEGKAAKADGVDSVDAVDRGPDADPDGGVFEAGHVYAGPELDAPCDADVDGGV